MSSGTTVPLSPTRNNFTWPIGVAERAAHPLQFFWNLPPQPPTSRVGNQPPYPCVEDSSSIGKHKYTRKYQSAYLVSLSSIRTSCRGGGCQ